MENVEFHDFTLRIKSADGAVADRGTFTGLASTYETDQGGDRVVPGAFTRTLQAQKGVVPLLWQHQSDNPIGSLKCTETKDGLAVEGTILLSNPVGRNAYDLLKAGVLKGLSIGYQTIQEAYEDGVRLLKEVKLYEGSVVTFPMNEGALIASVKNLKSLTDSERGNRLKSIDSHRKKIDWHQRAMREDMKALFGDELFMNDDTVDDQTLIDDEVLSDDDSKAFAIELAKMLASLKA